jgi:arylsulfatase A-like enzyme
MLCLIPVFILVGGSISLAADRPNVIFVMADDLGWGDTGYNGNTVIRTPHLDQMSRSGIQFNRFYSASSVCSPTRGACLTGRNPYRFGVYTANRGHLRAQEISLVEVMKREGDATGHFGKWHLGTLSPDYSGKGPGRKPQENYSTPGMNGFDEWFSTEFAVATWDPYEPENSHLSRNMPWDTRALYWQNGKNITKGLTGCDSKLIMDRALPFIEKQGVEGRPFFVVIWFHAPHAPVVGGPAYRKMYSKYEEDEQHYYAVVTALDEQVGRLRAALKRADLEENTMLWFCSDNGPEGNPEARARSRGSAGPFRGRKRSLYEGGIRVPGMVVWPSRIPESRQVDLPCVTSDYFPTVLDVIGLDVPSDRPYDGISLLPLIDRNMTKRPTPIGFQFGSQATLTDNRFKLVHNTSEERHRSDNGSVPYSEYELYDLINDPSETKNIIDSHPQIAERMKETLQEWQASCKSSDEGQDYR